MTIGTIYNGSITLPQKRTREGKVIPDASLAEVHEDKKHIINTHIEHGVRAEDLGFDRYFLTEHHFQPTGSEFSPNPLMSQMSIASLTDEIRLGQLTNVITWHDPVRFAEQAAMLDIVSGGRAEIGIGRGYQPRENEVLGQYWGGKIQDQEENRASFEEKYEIIKRCWTEEIFQYRGEFHSIPPSYTKWHLDLDKAYFDDEVTEQTTDEVMNWTEDGDLYSELWNEVVSGGTTLNQIAVFPQPLQQPHPQLWMPVTSRRSIEWAAQRGINGASLLLPNEHLSRLLDWYMEAAEEAGWPDHRPEFDGEPFERGWDADRQRGILPVHFVWNTDAVGDDTNERWAVGQENFWNFIRPNIAGVSELFDDPAAEDWITTDMILDEEFIYYGDTDTIIDRIATKYEACDYADLGFVAQFETPGITAGEEAEQMAAFAEDVIPYLREEFPTSDPRTITATD